MNYENIKEQLGRFASAVGNEMELYGYVSSSTGAVMNLRVRYEGDGFYTRILREALEELEHDTNGITARPEQIDEEAWSTALRECRQAWEASLSKSANSASEEAKDRAVRYASTDLPGVLLSQVSPDTLAVTNLRLLSCDPPQVRKEANHRNAVTAAKSIIRERSVMRSYIGILTLSPSKVEEITID